MNNLRKLDVDDLGPHITRDIDLCRSAATPGLENHPVQYFSYSTRIPDFLLITDHLPKHGHLLDFLKSALPDGFVRCLRGDQQHGRVIPVSGLYRSDKTGNTRTVLSDRHTHFASGTCIAVTDQPTVGFMSHIPKLDASLRKQIRDRHESRSDDAEGMFDPMSLKHLYKGLFGCHFHCCSPVR